MAHLPSSFAAPAFRPAPIASGAELALLLLGPSRAMTQLWGQIRRLAPHVRTVLLTGEAETGQEAVARLLLDLSLQPKRTFVQLNPSDAEHRLARAVGPASLPMDLFLFLPEVDRLSLAAQEGLLRLMRMRRSRLFTIVASSSEDLRALVAMGRFSPALADALTSVRIPLPPLRQRPEDLPMLVHHMLATYSQQAGTLTPHPTEDFLQAVMEHPWAGNLRQFSQALKRLASHASGQNLHAADLEHASCLQDQQASQHLSPVRLVPLETVIQEHISAVLQACRGNKLRASEVLGISRSTLYRMLDTSAPANAAALALAN